jgi:lipoate-protein ligase A
VKASWRLLRDGPGSAAWNMSVDEALLARAQPAAGVLRLYCFERPAVSLGYRQAVPVWAERARALGMELVRRPSGGGAVVHDGDLVYAVVAHRELGGLPRTARGVYAWVRDAIAQGLTDAGLAVRPAAEGSGRSELCFASSTGFELELEHCKLVGSAQRRVRAGWLQHGSIRLGDDAHWYTRALGEPAPARPPLPRGLAAGALADAIAAAFALRAGCPLQVSALRAEEREEALLRQGCRLHDPLAAVGFPADGAALR